MQTTTNVIDKNWKALIKPSKLDISSNEDKTIAKVIAEPLEKGFGQTIGKTKCLTKDIGNKIFIIISKQK